MAQNTYGFTRFLESNPVLLSSIAELDETFVPDCYKGSQVPRMAGREARKHGAKATKRGISNEYVGIQCDGGTIVAITYHFYYILVTMSF